MRSGFVIGCLAAIVGLAACANDTPTSQSQDSVELRLQQLPADPEDRAKMLGELQAEYPSDSRVQKAVDEFSRELAPGHLRTVTFQDGRNIQFIVRDVNAIVAESGKDGQSSIIGELGLSGLSPAEIWRRLLPNEAVPVSLVELEKRETSYLADQVAESVPTALEQSGVGTQGEGTSTSVTTAGTTSDVAVARQALSTSASDFLNRGGCTVSPIPYGTVYQGIVATYCNTGYTGDGMWTAYSAWQARWHVDNVGSGSFTVNVYRGSGNLVWTQKVTSGQWWNIALGVRYTGTYDCCCGIFCIEACGCPIVAAKDYLRLTVTDAAGDPMRVSGLYFNSTDNRFDSTPFF